VVTYFAYLSTHRYIGLFTSLHNGLTKVNLDVNSVEFHPQQALSLGLGIRLKKFPPINKIYNQTLNPKTGLGLDF